MIFQTLSAQTRRGEVAGHGVKLTVGVLADALDEAGSGRVGRVEHEGAAQRPRLVGRGFLGDQDLPVLAVQRKVALHELPLQPGNRLAAVDVAADRGLARALAGEFRTRVFDRSIEVFDDGVAHGLAARAQARAGAHAGASALRALRAARTLRVRRARLRGRWRIGAGAHQAPATLLVGPAVVARPSTL